MSEFQRAKVFEGLGAVTRLHDLDRTLAVDDFLEALRYGVIEGHRSTPSEPQTSGGWVRWAKIVGSLRETLRKKGWSLFDKGNHALVVNPSGTIGIVVSSGDENTGIDDPLIAEPRCNNPKGPALATAVEANVQHQFADASPEFRRFTEPSPARLPSDGTWIFLYIETVDEQRCELSFPTDMEGDYVTGWGERIIFTGDDGERAKRLPRADDEPPLDVPIARKVG